MTDEGISAAFPAVYSPSAESQFDRELTLRQLQFEKHFLGFTPFIPLVLRAFDLGVNGGTQDGTRTFGLHRLYAPHEATRSRTVMLKHGKEGFKKDFEIRIGEAGFLRKSR